MVDLPHQGLNWGKRGGVLLADGGCFTTATYSNTAISVASRASFTIGFASCSTFPCKLCQQGALAPGKMRGEMKTSLRP